MPTEIYKGISLFCSKTPRGISECEAVAPRGFTFKAAGTHHLLHTDLFRMADAVRAIKQDVDAGIEPCRERAEHGECDECDSDEGPTTEKLDTSIW